MQGTGGEGPGGDAPGVTAEGRQEAGEPADDVPGGGVSLRDAPPTTATITAKPPAPRQAPPGPGAPAGPPGWRRWLRSPGRALATGPLGRHLWLLACYLTVGIAVTWPRATYLADGKLQATRDAGVYVWDFWWMARAVEHLSNPWFTRAIVAPAGVQLGYHALMPLEGAAMMPVTVLFGPSASDNLLSILMPGLMCYAMYRAARLWLRTQTGAVITGAFFGLSSIMAWHAWYQLNLAAGAVFLPLGAFDPEAQVLATADGHPRAVGYLSRLPEPTLMAVRRNPFYAGLLSAQGQPRGLVESVTGYHSYTALLAAARAEARRMDVGWVIVWQRSPDVLAYMAKTGFRFACAADGAWVYRAMAH